MAAETKCTQIIVILDESGSMMSLKKAAVDGSHKFIEDQKELMGGKWLRARRTSFKK